MPRVKKNKPEETIQAPAEDTAVVAEQAIEEEIDDSPIAIVGTSVTQNQLAKYKEQYKRVFFTDFAGQYFIWHRLNRTDFTEIYNRTQDIEDIEKQTSERERQFCLAAILYPKEDMLKNLMDADDIMTSRICDEILYKSGFFRPQTTEL